jgi:hypothetical protein
MAYNRAGAVKYALKHWNVPCHDHVICTNTPWRFLSSAARLNAKFIQDTGDTEHAEWTERSGKLVRVEWKELDDCAHFVSCSIGKGGGLKVPSPVKGVCGHFEPGHLVNWLFAQGSSTHTVFKKSFSEAEELLPTLNEGDVIAYHSPRGSRGYTHSALYLGKGKIACHTRCRKDGPWDLGRQQGYLYTLVHFTVK